MRLWVFFFVPLACVRVYEARIVSNEDIRDAILSVVNMIRSTEDKLERHEFRERTLGDQIKKVLSTIDKRQRLLDPVKGTIGRLDERLATVETILLQKDERERIQVQKVYAMVEQIHNSLPQLFETLKNDISSSLPKENKDPSPSKGDLVNLQKEIEIKIDNTSNNVKNLEGQLSKIREENKNNFSSSQKFFEKYQDKLKEYNKQIDVLPDKCKEVNDVQTDIILKALETQNNNIKKLQKEIDSSGSLVKSLERKLSQMEGHSKIGQRFNESQNLENVKQHINTSHEVLKKYEAKLNEYNKKIDGLPMTCKTENDVQTKSILKAFETQNENVQKIILTSKNDVLKNCQNAEKYLKEAFPLQKKVLDNIDVNIKTSKDNLEKRLDLVHTKFSDFQKIVQNKIDVSSSTVDKIQNKLTQSFVDSLKTLNANITHSLENMIPKDRIVKVLDSLETSKGNLEKHINQKFSDFQKSVQNNIDVSIDKQQSKLTQSFIGSLKTLNDNIIHSLENTIPKDYIVKVLDGLETSKDNLEKRMDLVNKKFISFQEMIQKKIDASSSTVDKQQSELIQSFVDSLKMLNTNISRSLENAIPRDHIVKVLDSLETSKENLEKRMDLAYKKLINFQEMVQSRIDASSSTVDKQQSKLIQNFVDSLKMLNTNISRSLENTIPRDYIVMVLDSIKSNKEHLEKGFHLVHKNLNDTKEHVQNKIDVCSSSVDKQNEFAKVLDQSLKMINEKFINVFESNSVATKSDIVKALGDQKRNYVDSMKTVENFFEVMKEATYIQNDDLKKLQNDIKNSFNELLLQTGKNNKDLNEHYSGIKENVQKSANLQNQQLEKVGQIFKEIQKFNNSAATTQKKLSDDFKQNLDNALEKALETYRSDIVSTGQNLRDDIARNKMAMCKDVSNVFQQISDRLVTIFVALDKHENELIDYNNKMDALPWKHKIENDRQTEILLAAIGSFNNETVKSISDCQVTVGNKNIEVFQALSRIEEDGLNKTRLIDQQNKQIQKNLNTFLQAFEKELVFVTNSATSTIKDHIDRVGQMELLEFNNKFDSLSSNILSENAVVQETKRNLFDTKNMLVEQLKIIENIANQTRENTHNTFKEIQKQNIMKATIDTLTNLQEKQQNALLTANDELSKISQRNEQQLMEVRSFLEKKASSQDLQNDFIFGNITQLQKHLQVLLIEYSTNIAEQTQAILRDINRNNDDTEMARKEDLKQIATEVRKDGEIIFEDIVRNISLVWQNQEKKLNELKEELEELPSKYLIENNKHSAFLLEAIKKDSDVINVLLKEKMEKDIEEIKKGINTNLNVKDLKEQLERIDSFAKQRQEEMLVGFKSVIQRIQDSATLVFLKEEEIQTTVEEISEKCSIAKNQVKYIEITRQIQQEMREDLEDIKGRINNSTFKLLNNQVDHTRIMLKQMEADLGAVLQGIIKEKVDVTDIKVLLDRVIKLVFNIADQLENEIGKSFEEINEKLNKTTLKQLVKEEVEEIILMAKQIETDLRSGIEDIKEGLYGNVTKTPQKREIQNSTSTSDQMEIASKEIQKTLYIAVEEIKQKIEENNFKKPFKETIEQVEMITKDIQEDLHAAVEDLKQEISRALTKGQAETEPIKILINKMQLSFEEIKNKINNSNAKEHVKHIEAETKQIEQKLQELKQIIENNGSEILFKEEETTKQLQKELKASVEEIKEQIERNNIKMMLQEQVEILNKIDNSTKEETMIKQMKEDLQTFSKEIKENLDNDEIKTILKEQMEHQEVTKKNMEKELEKAAIEIKNKLDNSTIKEDMQRLETVTKQLQNEVRSSLEETRENIYSRSSKIQMEHLESVTKQIQEKLYTVFEEISQKINNIGMKMLIKEEQVKTVAQQMQNEVRGGFQEMIQRIDFTISSKNMSVILENLSQELDKLPSRHYVSIHNDKQTQLILEAVQLRKDELSYKVRKIENLVKNAETNLNETMLNILQTTITKDLTHQNMLQNEVKDKIDYATNNLEKLTHIPNDMEIVKHQLDALSINHKTLTRALENHSDQVRKHVENQTHSLNTIEVHLGKLHEHNLINSGIKEDLNATQRLINDYYSQCNNRSDLVDMLKDHNTNATRFQEQFENDQKKLIAFNKDQFETISDLVSNTCKDKNEEKLKEISTIANNTYLKVIETFDKNDARNSKVQESMKMIEELTETLNGNIAISFERLIDEIQSLQKLEEVMAQTSDSVTDMKRRVEYGVRDISLEVGNLIKSQMKDFTSSMNLRFDEFESSLVDNETGAIANISTGLSNDLEHVWRQIGIIHQDMPAIAAILKKLENNSDSYMNSTTRNVDITRGKVTQIQTTMDQVDQNINMLLGRFSLITQEFNQIKLGLGNALNDIKRTLQNAQPKAKPIGAGPYPINSI